MISSGVAIGDRSMFLTRPSMNVAMARPSRSSGSSFSSGGGISGGVEEVQILTTTLKTADNKRITVPNGQIMDSIITNYSANDTRRVDMVIGVSYDDDIDKVVWRNPLEFFAQSGRLDPAEMETPVSVDQRNLWQGNSVLRGQTPRTDG